MQRVNAAVHTPKSFGYISDRRLWHIVFQEQSKGERCIAWPSELSRPNISTICSTKVLEKEFVLILALTEGSLFQPPKVFDLKNIAQADFRSE
jgi:hypothetical protein